MEPDKFEKHIKDKLTERNIKPTSKAWDGIVDQLQPYEGRTSKKRYVMGIAASFIGVLIVSTLYMMKRDVAVENRFKEVVIPATSISDVPEQEIEEIHGRTGDQVVPVSQESVVVKPQIIDKAVTVAEVSDHEIGLLEKKTVVAQANKIATASEKLIDAKIAKVVAQIEDLERNNLQVSDAEVDSLLRSAQQEILVDKMFDQHGKVDAMALLNEVEGELDQTFRDQIFETLKTGFQKVRTAVADRNN